MSNGTDLHQDVGQNAGRRLSEITAEITAAVAAGKRRAATLDDAFEHLFDLRILAEKNLPCCQSCGVAAIHDHAREIDDDFGGDEPLLGYCFYHEQDKLRLDDGMPLYLNYGPFLPAANSQEDADAAAVEVGELVCAMLRLDGFSVEWNGDVKYRIKVVDGGARLLRK